MLVIYYDNPNEASDMYLKWLTKDCEEKDVEYKIVDNFEEYINNYKNNATLPMMPVKDKKILGYLRLNSHYDIDNVSGDNFYTDATAQGIYNYVENTYSNRSTVVAVIGRGKVGKPLINMLIDYGYTVFEFNSKSEYDTMIETIKSFVSVAIGLSTENVFNYEECKGLECFSVDLIDASNTFDTKNKLRCGKWTREVILSRV